ncbi:MAG: hypothetical protein CVV23_17305 [Ignavibacteriae bacterium HGW-Ignavibacteriae-2]|nr:MAG: hypothetical protein CVV23_17305 [Ignavibacteriae bacterium HGW-Ignavibacteriae-2]
MFELPASFVFTTQNQGVNDALDSDVDVATGKTTCINLVLGDTDLTWDAGIYQLSGLGDKVWNDLNKNGIQDNNESGVQNVIVKLYDCNNIFLTQTTTDVNGNYSFSNLTPGDYYVVFTLPSGYVFSPKDQGGNDTLDSDADATTGRTVCTTITSGETDLTWDAGIYETPESTDIEVVKTVSNTNPQNGDQFTYTITATNHGPVDATSVKVADILPAGLIYIGSSSSNGSLYNYTTGIWNVGNLANSASATLTITVEVNLGNCQSIDLGTAEGYNLFVFEDLNQPSADTEGKAAIGGNAYFANYSIGDKLAANSGDVLIVGGHLEYVSGGVFNGNVVYGTSSNLPRYSVSIINGTVRQDNIIDFDAAEVYLKSLSASLSAYPANGTVVNDWNNLILTGTDPFLNVFNVSGSELSNAWGTTINVPNGAVVLLNIDGQSIDWNGGLFVNGTAISNVLYNFYEAKNMLVQGIDVRGTLLAPHADLNFPAGVINGQVIVKSMTGSGQFNNSMFTGNIPCSGSIVNYATLSFSSPSDNNSNNNESFAGVTIGDGQGNAGGGNSGGSNNTNDWVPAGSFGLTEVVWSIAADLSGNLLAGTAGGHLYKSPDGGVNWTLINQGMTIGFIWDIAVHPNGTIVIGTEQGIFSTADNGSNWSGPLGGYVYDMRAVEIDPNTGDIYAAAWGFGIFKSVNNGTSWSKVNNGLTSLIVNSITIDNHGRVFAGTFGGGVFVSQNAGSSWTKSNLGYDFVWALATTSTDIVYAATYGKGVYRSADNGNTWEELNSGLTAEHVYSVAVNANDEVYVSTWTGGVYKLMGVTPSAPGNISTTTSLIWSAVGMNGYGISALMVDKNASMIYAGGTGGTIYKKREDGNFTDVNNELEVPAEFNLSQNYPNPFNPSTSIEFGIREAGQYSLLVYNIIGEQVAELVNGELNAGRHQVHFDANRLSSGIYIYKLVGNKVNITRKMILMK